MATFTPPLPTSIVEAGQPGQTLGHDDYHEQIHGWLAKAGEFGYVLAANDSAADSRTLATVVCDGIGDQAEFNTALGSGRPVAFLEGTYSLNGSLLLPGVSAARTLVGSGWTSVLDIQHNGDAIADSLTAGQFLWGWNLLNFKVQANGNVRTAGNTLSLHGVWCKIRHVWVNKPWGNGIFLRNDNNGSFGHHNLVDGCLIDEGEQSNGGDGRAIRFEESDENLVTGATTLQANGRAAAGEPNHVFDLAGLNRAVGVFIVGGQTGWKFQGPDGAISNVTFDGCKNHSVRVNGTRAQILGCHVYNVGYTGTNLDGIFVDNVAGTKIHTTTVDTIGSGQANGGSARSGINMSSGTVDNSDVADNTLRATGLAYGTAALIPPTAGTGNRILDNRGFNPQGPAAITVTASPFTYTAGPTPEQVFVSGGTVSSITKSGTTLGITSGAFHLRPGQAIVVTYSAAPTMVKDRH